jgi:type II secretory pathway component PulF
METLSNPLTVQSILLAALWVLAYLALNVAPACLVMWLIYFVLTLPMRRRERARLFLDFLESGLNRGASPELAMQQASASRDGMLGIRFHLLAAWIEEGMSLTDALKKVRGLLPPQIVAMLKAGLRIGDVRKVLPACRHLLAEGPSHVRSAVNYLVLMVFLITPATAFVIVMFRVKIQPSFKATIDGMGGTGTLPAFTRFIFGQTGIFAALEILVFAGLLFALALYVGGPRLRDRLSRSLGLEIISSWRLKRLKRDFSAMLAVLLDARVPEIEAVTLAGDSTAAPSLIRKAAIAAARLREGVKLPDALQAIDESGEFEWRLRNALRGGRGFLQALAGWHDALEAKAFQLEQAATQVTTTGLVLLNGLIVGMIVTAVFAALIAILNEAVLW